MKKGSLFGVGYAVGNMDEAISEVLGRGRGLKGKYICFSNVHTLVTAIENEKYRRVLNGSAYTFPDGAPVARELRKTGRDNAERIAGPDFMAALLKATADGGISHYFYGSTDDSLDALEKTIKARYPGISIAGRYSPPFRKLSDEEDAEITGIINEAAADIVWVSLGAPKQEIFMYNHRGRINALMIGIGAGVDFLAGTVKRAPLWMQKASLEWLYRLISEPKRLAKRYIVTNTKFFLYCLKRKSRLF